MAKGNGRGKTKCILNIPVKFGGVSIGQETARIGVTFDRDNVALEQADEVFCGHRLSGRVVLGNRDDAPGTVPLIDSDIAVAGSFDTKHLSVSAAQIGAGLTFNLADVNVAELARFSKGAGRLIVEGVGEIPENAPREEHDDDGEPKHVAGSLKFDEKPEHVLLSDIFKGKKRILKAFADAGLETVSDLGEFTSSDKKLADLSGMGPGSAKIVTDTMIAFDSDNR